MTKLGEREVENKSDMLRIKKIYVLAGLLTEDHIATQSSITGGTRSLVLSSLLPEDSVLIEQIWHRATAYHFMLLAQRQLRSGLMNSAVITSLRLRDYVDVLNVEDVYSLLALASCANRSFGTCSRAFIKLESLENIPEVRRQEYEELAVNIFSKYDPADNKTERINCFSCEALVPNW